MLEDEQFRQLCNVYGFAPSRALRELLDTAISQSVLAEREACADEVTDMGNKGWDCYHAAEAIRARGQQ